MRTLTVVGFAVLIHGLCASGEALQDWASSTPSAEGLRSECPPQLDAHIRAELPHLRSLLIARHGRLVFERYYGDASREGLHNIQSMTKTVSSALIGIALKKGLIASLDNRVVEYLSDERNGIRDPRMSNVTIRHLLTIASGLDEMPLSFDKALANPVAEIVRAQLLYPPGQGFRYSSAAAHLLGEVLRRATHTSVLEFAQTELLSPLGISEVVWYADKTGLQSGGMSALWRSRDILKLGELYLRHGKWRGKQLIPREYVAESVKLQNEGDFYGERARYGYMWWITRIAGHEGFYARGYGGQYLIVFPDADLVVLCTSDWKKPEYPEHFALLEKFILPSLTTK